MRKFIPIAASALGSATAQAEGSLKSDAGIERSMPRAGSGRNITFS